MIAYVLITIVFVFLGKCYGSRSSRLLYPHPQSKIFSTSGPCGDSSTQTNRVTKVYPGPLTVKWLEKSDGNELTNSSLHPTGKLGPFRIALRDDSAVDADFGNCILLDNIPKKNIH